MQSVLPHSIEALLTQGAETIAAAEAACAVSRILNTHRIALAVAGAERRGARRLQGGRDLDEPYIADLIAHANLCAACIAARIGIPLTEVDDSITSYGHTLVVTSTVARCDACLKETVVHRLG